MYGHEIKTNNFLYPRQDEKTYVRNHKTNI